LHCLLYPNPCQGNFTVSYVGKTSDLLSVDIIDITGRVLQSQLWPVIPGQNNRTFSVEHLPKGLYLTRISSGAKSSTTRLLVN
jgi:hypothetical protein